MSGISNTAMYQRTSNDYGMFYAEGPPTLAPIGLTEHTAPSVISHNSTAIRGTLGAGPRTPPAAPSFVVPAGGDVPARVARLFREFDTAGDGVVHLHELEAALAREFPELSADVQREVRPLFEHHTAPTGGGLTITEFCELYGALLFRNFDANHDGVLQTDELERALEYLGGHAVALGVPLDETPPVVTKELFWSMCVPLPHT